MLSFLLILNTRVIYNCHFRCVFCEIIKKYLFPKLEQWKTRKHHKIRKQKIHAFSSNFMFSYFTGALHLHSISTTFTSIYPNFLQTFSSITKWWIKTRKAFKRCQRRLYFFFLARSDRVVEDQKAFIQYLIGQECESRELSCFLNLMFNIFLTCGLWFPLTIYQYKYYFFDIWYKNNINSWQSLVRLIVTRVSISKTILTIIFCTPIRKH